MTKAPNISGIRLMKMSDIDIVLSWRNHIDVRSHMFNSGIISLEDHIRWYEKAKNNRFDHLLIYEQNSCPIGYVKFSREDHSGVVDWGFYLSPYSKKGVGLEFGRSALKYAFMELGLNKINGSVLEANLRSIKFHINQGFLHENELDYAHFDGQSWRNVLCFGLTRDKWRNDIEMKKI